MKTMRRFVWFAVLAVLLLPFWAACGTTKNLVQKVMPGGSALKKRVMVTTPIDMASLGDAMVAEAKGAFVDRLVNHRDLLVFSYESAAEAALADKPPYGPAAPVEIVDAAAAQAMNAVITWSFTPVEVEVRSRWAWPFRSKHRIYKTSIIVNVVDVVQGAIIATETLTQEFSVPADEMGPEADDAQGREAWRANLPKLLEEQARVVQKTLADTPWRTRLILEADGGLRIPAGADVGLKPGQVFEVFAPGEEVPAKSGKLYKTQGPKLGELEVTTVGERESSGKLRNPMEVEPGQVLGFKS